MTLRFDQVDSPPETDELVRALMSVLGPDPSNSFEIVEVKRTPSPYTSSFPLEELTVTLETGRRLELVFKNVSPQALSDSARRAKPGFLADPLREITVYRTLLNSTRHGTARHYGSVVDESRGRYWIFLENVDGHELYTIGDFDVWRQTARWLASFHHDSADAAHRQPNTVNRLIRYDAEYYGCWIERALSIATACDKRASSEEIDLLRRLATMSSQTIEELAALPVTVIHGEFYASNVIVVDAGSPLRICPVDWERAAIGPGLIDLAALISGNWTEEQKEELALAYYRELKPGGGPDSPDFKTFLRQLDLCRLHQAVQWLGWSATWTPPVAHEQDWYEEARLAAHRVGRNIEAEFEK